MAIKPSVIQGLRNYVDHGIPPGSFLRAVLENNLVKAFACADDENTLSMHEIVKYCYNELPHICWGSPEKVENWMEKKRLERLRDEFNHQS